MPDVNAESTHLRAHERQIFLELIGDARLGERAAAGRTRRRQRHGDRFVNVRWRWPITLPPVPASRTAPAPTRLRHGRAFRKRGGLPFPGALRHHQRGGEAAQFRLQSIAFPAQPFAVALEFRNLLFQFPPLLFEARVVTTQLVTLVSHRRKARALRSSRHPLVMPKFRPQYKRNPLTNYP